jgi:hypothetical protein
MYLNYGRWVENMEQTIEADEIEIAWKKLPFSAQQELAQFIRYLQYKYEEDNRKIVQLGGMWQNIQFDIGQDDVRLLRQKISEAILS